MPGLQNVIRHARIGSGNAIEDVIEWNFRAIRVAVLAGFNQPLGFPQGGGVDEYDVLLFRRWVEGRRVASKRTALGLKGKISI